MLKTTKRCATCARQGQEMLCHCYNFDRWVQRHSTFYWTLRELWQRLSRDWAASAAWATIGAVTGWFLIGAAYGLLGRP